jgi:biopolymer transport protein ExbD
MATLQVSENSKAVKGRKQNTTPRVDLTAMVDLMFLLTTFFMLTTTLAEHNAASLIKPIQSEEEIAYPESRTMTILLAKDNKVVSYMGLAKEQNFIISTKENLLAEINKNMVSVANKYANDPKKPLILIIKPTLNSIYKNFVDVLDDINIAGVKSYSVDDNNFLAHETAYLKQKGL